VPLLPSVFSVGQTLLSKFLTNSIGGSCRLPLSISFWKLIAAISSGQQRVIGNAPTAAKEAEGLGD
jgi:hypothetical protein